MQLLPPEAGTVEDQDLDEYRITLKNCAFFARHGVYSEEEALGQRFFVDCILWLEGAGRLEEDRIDATVDYGAAFKVIERIVMGKRHNLIEALALEIAKAVNAEFPMVKRARVTIRKPNAPVPGILDYVEVAVSYPISET
jgi:7,8-dihydroneopterin aldolase/epimerase/oxygenase